MACWSAFSGDCFSGLSDVLGWSSNGSGVTGQAFTQLEIATTGQRALLSNWLLFVILDILYFYISKLYFYIV